jgi:hypothetical protein
MEDLIKDGSLEEDLEPLFSLEHAAADKSMDNDSLNKSSTQEHMDEGGHPAVVTSAANMALGNSQNSQELDNRNGIDESSLNVLEAPGIEPKSSVTPAGKFKVHNEQGSYLMDATKWPSLNVEVSDEELAQLTQEEDLMDRQVVMSLDEESSQGWASPIKLKKKRPIQRKKVTVATRASSRIPRDGIPIATKAMHRARDWDNISTGMFPTNPFTVLNSIPNDELNKVLVDLDIDIENLDEQINLFKTEELVRADLAQANYKEYIDRINKKTTPQDDDAMQDLAMEVIDNTCRDISRDEITDCSKNSKPTQVKLWASGPTTRNKKK